MTAAASAHPTPPSDSAVPPSGGGVIEDFPAVPLNAPASAPPPRLTVVVAHPRRGGERPAAAGAARPVARGARAEILVVDDSDDDTAEVLARDAGTCPDPGAPAAPRQPDAARGGLGGAVLAGARHAARATGSW